MLTYGDTFTTILVYLVVTALAVLIVAEIVRRVRRFVRLLLWDLRCCRRDRRRK